MLLLVKTILRCSPGGEIACFFNVEDILLTRSTNPDQGECLSAQIVDELVEVSHPQPFRTITITINNSVKTNLFVVFSRLFTGLPQSLRDFYCHFCYVCCSF